MAPIQSLSMGFRGALTAGVFVFVGMSSGSGFPSDGTEREERGFVRTGTTLVTIMQTVFAAGDVRSGSTEQDASAARARVQRRTS